MTSRTGGGSQGKVLREDTLGGVRMALLLDDAEHTIAGDRAFSPAKEDEWGPGLPVLPGGTLNVFITACLISEDGRHTLVDTGFGDELRSEREYRLQASLALLGVQPKDVSRVIITHAHGDHFTGNTLHRGDRWVPAYPLAEYVVQEREVAAMRDAGEAMWTTRFQPLVDRGQLRLIDGDTDMGGSVACRLTPGHTRGHQSVLVSTSEGDVMYLGDLALMARSLERPEWNPSWAWSIETDIASRRAVIDWACETGALLVAGHDAVRPYVKLVREGDGVRAVDA